MLSQESREWLLCSVTNVVILALSGISLWLVISGLMKIMPEENMEYRQNIPEQASRN